MAKKATVRLSADTKDRIRQLLLAGEPLAGVREHYPDIPLKRLKSMREAVFAPLKSDPAKVKALANGSLLNANAIVRWKERAPRREPPAQVEMFGA